LLLCLFLASAAFNLTFKATVLCFDKLGLDPQVDDGLVLPISMVSKAAIEIPVAYTLEWVRACHRRLEQATWSTSETALRKLLPWKTLVAVLEHATARLALEHTLVQVRVMHRAVPCTHTHARAVGDTPQRTDDTAKCA
jgi:hypothetical protein